MKSMKSTKYLVEGDINFFDELNKLVQTSNESVPTNNDKTVCLITEEPLTDLSVNLTCGHAFNYIPLYKEVCLQKSVKNILEISRISFNEIKCPYCRKIQQGLLPFQESIEKICPKVYGVNSLTSVVKTPKEPKLVTPTLTILCPQLLKTGANKGTPCGKSVYSNTAGLCTRHYNLSLKVVNPVPTIS